MGGWIGARLQVTFSFGQSPVSSAAFLTELVDLSSHFAPTRRLQTSGRGRPHRRTPPTSSVKHSSPPALSVFPNTRNILRAIFSPHQNRRRHRFQLINIININKQITAKTIGNLHRSHWVKISQEVYFFFSGRIKIES